MEVKEIKMGNVLFNTNRERSALFVGQPVQICMTGKFKRDYSGGLTQLQNSVHGDVKLIGDFLKVKYPFCDINKDGCDGLTNPTCNSSISKNDDFCFCSTLTNVPVSPDVNRKYFQHSN
jgi:hypothetical protein